MLLAYVASVSARVRREKLGREQKKREWQGRGRGKKETLARKPHDFEKLRSPTNAASDWCGAGSVDYLALETWSPSNFRAITRLETLATQAKMLRVLFSHCTVFSRFDCSHWTVLNYFLEVLLDPPKTTIKNNQLSLLNATAFLKFPEQT